MRRLLVSKLLFKVLKIKGKINSSNRISKISQEKINLNNILIIKIKKEIKIMNRGLVILILIKEFIDKLLLMILKFLQM